MGGVFERLGSARFLLPGGAVSAEDEAAFGARCNEVFDATACLSAVLCAGFVLLFWPADLLLFRDVPDALPMFAVSRGAILVATLVFLVIPRSPALLRNIVYLYAVVIGAGYFVGAGAMGALGGPERPYVHLCYAIPFITSLLPMRLGPRIALAAFFGAATLAAMLLPFPNHAASPLVPMMVAHMSGHVGLSVIVGQFIMMLHRQTFLQARQLERSGAMLATRVAERTTELRALLKQVETAQEAERSRISRDLHDELGQELTALRYTLSYTRARFGEEPAAIGPNLDELEQLLARTSATARGIISELRPRILDDLGLAAAAKWLVARTEQRGDLECRLATSGDFARLTREQSTAAFRILQEALTNVTRHATASHVVVTLAVVEDKLDLEVIDDGKGIDDDAPGAGLGLVGMRERAGALGGTLDVVAGAERGTEVRCHLPAGDRASGGPAGA